MQASMDRALQKLGMHESRDEIAHLGLIVSFRETPCLVVYCAFAALLCNASLLKVAHGGG